MNSRMVAAQVVEAGRIAPSTPHWLSGVHFGPNFSKNFLAQSGQFTAK